MRGRLYLLLFACLAAGALSGGTANTTTIFAVAAVAVVAAAVSLRARRYARTMCLAAAFLFLGAILMFLACHGARNGILSQFAGEGAEVEVTGCVSSLQLGNDDYLSFFMSVSDVRRGGQLWRTRENLFISTEAESRLRHELMQGRKVTAAGRLFTPQGIDGWLIHNGAACLLSAEPGRVRVGSGTGDPLALIVSKARLWAAGRYEKLFQPRVAGFMEGVTLSKLDRIEPEVLSDLKNTGLSHVIAVSGMNVSSAVIIVLALLAIAGARRRTRYIGAGVAAFAVAGLAAFRPSAMRAFVMACFGFAAALAGREYDSLAGLSLAGIALICLNPMTVLDSGFRFSFAATLGIILSLRSGRGKKRAAGDGRARAFLRICSAAQLGVLPLILLSGGGVPVTALVANVVAVPLVGPILFTGWAAAVASLPSERLGRIFALLPFAMSRVILWVASALSGLPLSGLHRGVAGTAALLLYTMGLIALSRGAHTGRPIFRPLIAVSLSVIMVLLPLFPIPAFRAPDRLTVLDVGEGDAILVQDRTGANVLVDGGPDGGTVLEKLERRGVRSLDLVVLSHPHSDHAAGLVDVLRSMPVGRILDAGTAGGRNDTYSHFLSAARLHGVARTIAGEGQVIRVSSSTRLEVLHAPEPGEAPAEGAEAENPNELSVVIMASIGGSRVLLAGDIEEGGQREMLGLHPDLSCDVLKVPHQGAADAATRDLVRSCRPSVAIISVGKENSYGHPSARCLELLSEYGARIFRTDLDGDIELSFAGDRMSIKTGRDHEP